jgi:hypothetical protein
MCRRGGFGFVIFFHPPSFNLHKTFKRQLTGWRQKFVLSTNQLVISHISGGWHVVILSLPLFDVCAPPFEVCPFKLKNSAPRFFLF